MADVSLVGAIGHSNDDGIISMLRILNKLMVSLGLTVFLRLLANVLLLFAAIALISDATKTWQASSQIVMTPAGQHFQDLSPGVFAGFRAWFERTLPDYAWQPGMESVLLLPTWALFGGLAILLLWLGRRRQPVNVYVN